ncbi:alpha-amylase family glycosyl hydrolase [Mycoplasma phocimorsus]|uniref:alpha-amylase family glycosyl hydrolase n=1 Tax=Mycoplasma phocimorsus TaxID=3045839 RepID=UPI0024BF5660|nr:alpha-amylase family glycosyl hydrolase [Mycoplasma phocimorsus]MDJ1646666.1 alpha-amylase family glycosyl hydrolase [Mycoplasma phocimorsus]MDJ1647290.1 alpha-amylase family glycosyl hydrolase [Mycoplasma phocimorsus]MDJ1647621.1 alpha-amylase family glycosyl hydrolase [Mycoplasma phocimorsus]MDJ1648048.1 alpha-amylase family glycosyl hydrolase [Mycoplasma phocimorsus]
MSNKITTWKNKVVYEIFPRSFKDSNGDGNGDIRGIIEKIDYIADLGINAIWLTPIYKTEFADAGYDVLDYYDVWEKFGTLQDFKDLVEECKKRNIDIIMDLVLNHVSDDHPWFKKAISDPSSDEFSYFIWNDKQEEGDESIFGGSAWEYVPSVNKYYYHLFSKNQVDLNWGSPKTVKAMADVVEFWYNLGVKGFRLDAIQHVAKERENGKMTYSFAPKMVEYLQAFLKQIKTEKDDIFFVGEASGINPDKLVKYSRGENRISDAFYNFSFWYIGWHWKTGRNGIDKNWDFRKFASEDAIRYQNDKEIEGHQIFNFLTNHDTSRAISRYIKSFWYVEGAKTLALFMFAQKGIPTINYGEEIGMLNGGFKSKDEFRDVDVFNSFRIFCDEKLYYTEEEMLEAHNWNSRDNARIPMQWNSSENHGFTSAKTPWIKYGISANVFNVENEQKDPNSILNFYKQIISLRKNELNNFLVEGDSEMKLLENGLIQITRTYQDKDIVAIINLSSFELEYEYCPKKVIISTYTDQITNKLRPYESLLLKGNKYD